MPVLNRVSDWLFEPPTEPRTVGGIIRWWEARRLCYNVLIGSIGICSLIVFFFCILHANVLKPGEDAEEPLAIIFAPILVNICYTTGWMIEVLALRIPSANRYLRGPLLMRAGIAFSLFVVLLPSVFWGAVWITKGAAHLMRMLLHR